MEEKHLTNFSILLTKIVSTLGLNGNFLNLIKDMYKNPTANTIINVERLKAFSLSDQRQGKAVHSNVTLYQRS